jgi:hypothetical protein
MTDLNRNVKLKSNQTWRGTDYYDGEMKIIEEMDSCFYLRSLDGKRVFMYSKESLEYVESINERRTRMIKEVWLCYM